MRARRLHWAGILAVLGALAALALSVSPPARAGDPLLAPESVCPNPALAAPVSVQIRAMRCYHDYARRQRGVRVLRGVLQLDRSATLKARWIRVCRQFAHTPCGHSFPSTFSEVNYTRGSWRIGENIGWGSGSLAQVREMFAAWLRSPDHRSNILRPGWQDIGLARMHAVHLFGVDQVSIWVAQFGSH